MKLSWTNMTLDEAGLDESGLDEQEWTRCPWMRCPRPDPATQQHQLMGEDYPGCARIEDRRGEMHLSCQTVAISHHLVGQIRSLLARIKSEMLL